ncbi:uncharacterized protein LOC110987537 [Acanthaster planci]|uniref:Uncharacterized protein LOC110987537 n=1 Tax=Acanthaster planci TaxID=133434 RepID=A0A8B7ZMA6_ACAPL|nr:uncharacterized protein LOC110987537 [Acanthaster planci]
MGVAELLILAVCVASVMSVPAPFSAGRTCHIDDLQLKEDFSLERFMGTWYVEAHVQRTHYPYQRRSHYGLRQDGTLFMKTNRVMRPGDCNSWNFEARATANGDSDNPAKMLLYPPMPNYPPEDYWVVSTDYTGYALVYSCGEQRSDGSCTRRGEHAWLMARSVGGVPGEVRAKVPAMMSALCIRPERLRDVPRDCEKELTQTPTHLTPPAAGCRDDDDNTECRQGPSVSNACATANFRLQEDFIIEKFLGEWYEIGHTRMPDSTLKLPDMRSMLFSRDPTGQDAHMSLLMKDIKLEGRCGNMNMPGSGWLGQDNPAKILVSFPIPAKYGVSGAVEYWILSTDYTNYAVTYSCHHTYEDGTCDKQREALWVLSRTPTLPEGVGRRVDEAIRGACLDPVQVTDNLEVCYTTELGEGNETHAVIQGKAAVTSGCDPATAKYGCCLLNNRPATGPNYQGCPRVRPPVAGQDIDSRPVSEVVRPQPMALAMTAPESFKVKTVECDEKIICKIYCEYGFKKDENNCDICQCAEEPQEPSTEGHMMREAAQKTKIVSCLHQAPSATKIGLPILDCAPDGSFSPIQCHGEECWCVNPTTGYELRGTRVSHNTKPDCSQVLTPDQMVPAQTSDCLARRLEAQSSLDVHEGSGHAYIPDCDERGRYRPVQCYLEMNMCWCVDMHTGEQLGDSVSHQMLKCAP